jgi:ribosomal protein S14
MTKETAEPTRASAKCKNCGRPTKNDFGYCDACYKAYTGGAEPTQASAKCKNCGKPTKDDFGYCDACYKAYTAGGA